MSAVEKWTFLLRDSSKWDDTGKQICKTCLEEANRAAAGGGERCPRLFCGVNDMDIGDTFPELDELSFFEEEILAPI